MKRLSFFISLYLVVLLAVLPAQAMDKKVMVINSYHADYPWVVSHNSALQTALGMDAALSFHYLDTKRLSPMAIRIRESRAMEFFQQEKPNLVILADDYALKALGNKIMAAGTPVVFLGINNNPRNYLGSMVLATGVLERPLLKRSLVYLKDIMAGDLRHPLVLFDNGVTAHATVKQVFGGKQSLRFSHMVTDVKLNATYDEWKQAVLNAKSDGYDVIILGLYHTLLDQEGNHVDSKDVAQWTSEHSPVPLFGFWDFAIGKGKAVGGLVLSGQPQGTEAAKLAKAILSGTPPQNIQPVTAEHGRFLFSRHELERWKIKLPKYFDDPSEPITFLE